MKDRLVVLDFDGVLLNSYELLRFTFEEFDLDVGDENRFRNRRKFLKYFGGGKELLRNLVGIALPKKRRIREALTKNYVARGRVFPELVTFLNDCMEDPGIHVGVVSRNYALNPGVTIRSVLRASGVNEAELDFVIPVPVGVRKDEVLAAMRSTRYRRAVFAGDEVGDYRAASATGYRVLMACYGFDHRDRLVAHAGVPESALFETPAGLVAGLTELCRARAERREPVPA